MANKIFMGLKNVHYAVVTETIGEDGKIATTYATPKPWLGGVKLSASAQGQNDNFYADDRVWANLVSNQGYEGSLEMAQIPEDVYTDVFGFIKTSGGGIAEYSNAKTKYVALSFEFDGDEAARKFTFYRVMLNRHDVESETKKESIDPKTLTCSFKASPRPDDGLVRYYEDKDGTNYANWYQSVVVPSVG